MISALSAFRAGITDLRWYIEAIELDWALLAAATATPPCSPWPTDTFLWIAKDGRP
jgi:hypothetical protein